MTSVNVTTQSNTVTVQQGDATTVTIATQGPQGPAGAGASDVVNDTSPQLGGDLESNSFDIKFADNDKALFGADSDLQIFHDSNHSFIKDSGTGQLKILTSTTSIKNTSDNQSSAIFIPASSCTFFHSGSKKLETTSSGVTVTGNITSTANLNLPDSSSSSVGRIMLGDGTDMQIYHNSTDSYIDNETGILRIRNTGSNGSQIQLLSNNGGIKLQGTTGEQSIVCASNSGVELYHNNVKRCETSADGVNLPDNSKLQLGDSQDLQIFHDGTQSVIKDNGTGQLLISGENTIAITSANGTESYARFLKNGAVELFHDNVKKAETSADGFDAIGALRIPNDTGRIKLGASQDFQLYHGGTNSVINNNTGDLKISLTATDTIRLYQSDKSVGLFFNGSQKAETTSSGLTVTGTVTETSDIAFKSDVKPITNTLDKLQQITGYKYKLDNASIDSMGVIAQDVEKVFPELVHGDEGSKTLQYSGLIGVLVEAVKDLSAKVKALESN